MMEGTARKKTREEEPGVSKNYGATQSCRSILDSGGCLNYYILRSIFQYLGARDLGSAAMVCRSWSEAANNEKSIRGPCCFITHSDTDSLTYKMKNIRIKPSIGFFFVSNHVPPLRIIDHIKDLLPKHCEAILVIDNIFTDFEIDEFESSDDELNLQLLNGKYIKCAFLPQIPNVKIQLFKLVEECVIQKSAEYQEIIKTIVDHETSERSTCFMLFWNDKGYTTAKRWASAMQKSKEVKIASVCGGMVDEIYLLQQWKKKRKFFPKTDASYCVAVLITGSMQTWSTILGEKCDTKEQIEERLKLFKDKVKLKKHSIGFMFSCSDPGTEIVESTIFKRLFPEVPLSFLMEMHEGYYIAENDEEEHKCKKSKKSWSNEGSTYSTMFLILTYG